MSDTPKIFCYRVAEPEFGDCPSYALAEDGTVVGFHVSSSVSFAKMDMGCTAAKNYHHEAYREHYPDGYEMEWVDYVDKKGHEGFQAALAKNGEQP